MLRLVVIVVLRVGLFVVTGTPRAAEGSTTTVYACEDKELTITCPAPTTKIHVILANYGRQNATKCNDKNVDAVDVGWNTACVLPESGQIVRDRCLKSGGICKISATNGVFGDPCVATPKYLEVEYRCDPEDNPEITTDLLTSATEPDSERETTLLDWPEDGSTTDQSGLTTSDDRSDQCPAERRRSIDWPATRANTNAIQPCPNNANLMKAFRRCDASAQWIEYPDLSQCISQEVSTMLLKLDRLSEFFSLVVVNELVEAAQQISRQGDLYGGDLAGLSLVLAKTVVLTEENSETAHVTDSDADRINDDVFNSTDGLLSDATNETWRDLSESEQGIAATRLMSAVEGSASLLAKVITKTSSITRVSPNLVMAVDVLNVDDMADDDSLIFPSPDTDHHGHQSSNEASGGLIKLKNVDIKDRAVNGLGRVAFALYNNVYRWLSVKSNIIPPWQTETNYAEVDQSTVDFKNNTSGAAEVTVNTKIISATLISKPGTLTSLREPVEYTLAHNKPTISNPFCVFWSFSNTTYEGRWSNESCRLVSTNATHTTCECNHLTNFAVLMSVTHYEMPAAHKFALSLITYFGCLISIICLALAFATFYWFKNLQCDRNTIHKNLVLCLFISEVIFLLGIVQYERPVFCAVVAGLLHYFFLTSFSWMCLEGVQLYVLLIEVFEAEKSRIKWYYLGAYGVPALIVFISAAINPTGYGTQQHCWLSVDKGFIWAFVGPALAIIVVNSVMMGVAIHTMCRHSVTAASWKMKQKSKLETIGSWLKGAVVLMVLLGSTWIFGLLYIDQHLIFMAYIFTVLNSLQGLFIFIFHCLTNEKVQKEYRRFIQRATWLPESFRVKYGGATGSAALSTAPNQSTSSGGNVPMFFRMLTGRKRNQSLSSSSFQKSRQTSALSKKGTVRIVISPPGDGSSSTKVKRHVSSGSESARLTDSSGIASFDQDETTEDPSGYLDPVLTNVDENEFNMTEDPSMMEGSVVYMDYERRKNPQDSDAIRPLKEEEEG